MAAFFAAKLSRRVREIVLFPVISTDSKGNYNHNCSHRYNFVFLIANSAVIAFGSYWVNSRVSLFVHVLTASRAIDVNYTNQGSGFANIWMRGCIHFKRHSFCFASTCVAIVEFLKSARIFATSREAVTAKNLIGLNKWTSFFENSMSLSD